MEIALLTAVMVGGGVLLTKRRSQGGEAGGAGAPAAAPRAAAGEVLPDAFDATSTQVRARHSQQSILQGGAAMRGEISARKDNSLLLDTLSPYESQMSRIYGPDVGTKREMPKEIDPATRTDNVMVRSDIGYKEEYMKTVDRPVRMHNVNPIATTTGTASQLVGPGIGTSGITGDHGLHYGMVRMKPTIVQDTFREQKGSIIPGKSPVDKGEAPVHIEPHTSTFYTITPSGFAPSEYDTEPLKYRTVTKDYLLSAKGRAAVTGNPGAGGMRLEPAPDHTNRGSDNHHFGVRGAVGVQAQQGRPAHDASLSTHRGQRNEFMGSVTGSAAPGHENVIQNFHLPAEARATTECARGQQVLNLSNPGQSKGVLPSQDSMQTTQRQSMGSAGVTNLSPQMPPQARMASMENSSYKGMRQTGRLPNEFHPGGAAMPDVGGMVQMYESYAGGSLSNKTQRESLEHTQHQAPLKAVGVNAPMSYEDILKSEGYSNRDVPQLGFVPPAAPPGGSNVLGGVDTAPRFDARPDAPNAVREAGGGLANQQNSNLYVLNKNTNVNPNKLPAQNERLDPRILDALSRNDLARSSSPQ